jgi:hypothetical protein
LPEITEMGSSWTFRTALNDQIAAFNWQWRK